MYKYLYIIHTNIYAICKCKVISMMRTFLKNKMYIQILIVLFTYLKNQPDFEMKFLFHILIESVFHLIKKYIYA